MSTFFEIAFNIVSPVFIVAAFGVAIDRIMDIDPKPLSRLLIYLFSPFLIFRGIAYSDVSGGEAGGLIFVAVVMMLLVALLAWGVARFAGFDQRRESAFMLSATLINAGNYGLPLSRFAFGVDGEARALVFFVATVVVSYTLGVFLASRGSMSTSKALLNVLIVPLPYAALAGFAVNAGHITLPLPLDRAVGVLADGAIPCMLVVLGIQLSRASLKGSAGAILLASGLRLLAAPLIALVLVTLIGLHGLARDVSLVLSAMPTAVITGVLAAEFGADADFVTGTILVDTLISIVTISALLSIIM